ncbi:MAG: MATE family efflux transporter [Flavobacteriales bacterium]|nr:MATE family efflux transporter [Flavobacteriales bacterium]
MRSKRFTDIIVQALRGAEDLDFTSMGVRRAIVLLSIPMVLEMAGEALFAVVDVFFVSRIGVDAVATVGLTESVMTLIYSLAWGMGMGITAVVARRTGEKDAAGASRAALQGVMLAILLGALIAVPGVAFAPDILRLMGASAAVQAEGSAYTAIMFGSNVVILLLFGINAIFRGAGNAIMALWSLWLANIINCILDPILIFGLGPIPAMGVTGAAVATAIGRGCGVLLQFYYLFRVGEKVSLRGAPWRLDLAVMWNIVRVSFWGTVQFVIPSGSWMFLVRIISTFGSSAVAGYTIAVRIIIFSLLPAWGMANAASTLVGQNLGAKQPDRAARSAWLCGHYNMAFMVLVAILFWAFAPQLIGFFTDDAEVARYGVDALRIVCLGYFFYGYGMVLAQAFNGAGDTLTPTWMNVICFWMIEIPLAWFLSRFLGWGPDGVFASIAISESLLALLSGYLFHLGRWKMVKV